MSHKLCHAANGATSPSEDPFTLTAYPKTDVWRPSDDSDVFNAPYVFAKLDPNKFTNMSVTVSADWKTLYDQGGLILAYGEQNPRQWIKAGIEFFEGHPMIGVVGTDRYSDWSLTPNPGKDHNKATLEFVREGTELWIYLVGENQKRQAVREVRWAFISPKSPLEVGCYAAKPTPDSDNATAGVKVTFEGFLLK
ncbi:hypothetical protein K470DRAFT_210107 [Piedraia hortae CBS 480.64]|uniref:DUF1349-domain-containing protein n=1 Tax=Piedraia hortae CBS 480.64 TaxID=1314780 RepID=A0A6A7C8U0_9PEZI|nr:hypothetical protein K470DRAFT_210107 [Piedraia hortae CBS 480.64]